MLTSQDIKAAAKRMGADLVGIGSIDRWSTAPSQMDPKQIMPRAKSIICLGFRVLRGSLRGVEEGTYFSNYSAMGYGGITYLYMPMTVMNLSKFIEDEGYEAVPMGHQSDWRGIDIKGNIREKYSRPVAPGKAHPDVMNILLQILDDGRITDSHGKTVSFENTVIVMTTNAGSGGTTSMAGFFENQDTRAGEKTLKALSDFLRPEFLNRVDEIITFRSLSVEHFADIARIMLSDLAKTLSEKFITLTYTDGAAEYIAKNSYSQKFGARNMRRYVQSAVEDKIAEKIVETRGSLSHVALDCQEGELVITTL